MDLLEYQAKKLFRQIGIPVLPSETIAEPRELKQLQIPYPVVLKSQVRVGGRGKVGGVRFVTNTIDAIASARTIFNLSILGEYPEVILAEARYNAEQEIFLGIVLDYQLQRPVLFGSICGGMELDLLVKNLQQVVIETEFSPFLARRLVSRMGLSGELVLAVSEIIEKMYELFCTKDLDLIEINPLGVDAEGNLMALDGKITISDHALARHPELVSLSPTETNQASKTAQKSPLSFAVATEKIAQDETTTETAIRWLDWQDHKGKIAILANDDDLALLCWDLIRQKKEKPACAIVWDRGSFPEQSLIQQLQPVLAKLQSMKGIKVLLVNFWGTEELNLAIAQEIWEFFQPASPAITSGMGEERAIVPTNGFEGRLRSPKTAISTEQIEPNRILRSLKWVIRLATPNIEHYQQEFAHDAIFWTNNLEDSIAQAISCSKTK